MRKFLEAIIHFFIFRVVDLVNFVERLMARSEFAYKLLLIPGFENFRWGVGIYRGWRTFGKAYSSVPAYKKFIDKHGGYPHIFIQNNFLPNLTAIPEMDKESYIKKYSNESRLRGGVIPRKGVMVDESSGSSGNPTSWVRGPVERTLTKQMLQLSYHRVIGNEKVFIINAFALGAWATGLNVSMSLTDISIIKSTGPDMDKIINTINEFGAKYHYIILGYPPFLKALADDDRVDWEHLKVDGIYGGEGISESMRDYLLKSYGRIIGSYGASDLEINVAAESDFTIRLRKLILENQKVRDALIKTEYGVTPSVFQYNPLAYYLETNKAGELIVTLCRPFNLAPKIRYNIHDRGHVIRYGVLKKTLKELGVWGKFHDIPGKVDLPIVFLYGRSDMSIDYYGANVTPDSLREILFGIENLAPKLNTFRLTTLENKKHDKIMEIAVELTKGEENDFDEAELKDEICKRLADINRDFYNAYYNTAPKENHPRVKICEFGTGPFVGGQRKLKNEYVKMNLKYDKL